MWRIRQFIESINNLFVWLPIVWQDRQWDSWYTEHMLLHKITLQRNYIKKRQFFVGWENEVKWMNYCIYLLTMLCENKYWEDEWDGRKPSRNGLSEHMLSFTEYVESRIDNEYNGICADIWEDKARVLFWKIFIWKYQYWWD